ncbi:MAG: protein-L-isoaspartate O-methyltransferase [Gammaproteobacteria bacterium]|jgi:protein-L-isoaspartate(D-aspartate) O-methyltransferase
MTPVEIEQARLNMIVQQIRPWEVLDARVLEAMSHVPREAFVPERYRALAFADTNIPLGHDQVMMKPVVEGRLLQALDIRPEDNVLEIGTGSGYLTACLARLGRHVTSMEILPELAAEAAARLAGSSIDNITLLTGDALSDIAPDNHYDVIAVTGSLPVLDQQFYRNLDEGGRLFVITGQLPIMEARLITRISANNWASESLFETCIPPLVNAPAPETFSF